MLWRRRNSSQSFPVFCHSSPSTELIRLHPVMRASLNPRTMRVRLQNDDRRLLRDSIREQNGSAAGKEEAILFRTYPTYSICSALFIEHISKTGRKVFRWKRASLSPAHFKSAFETRSSKPVRTGVLALCYGAALLQGKYTRVGLYRFDPIPAQEPCR
jgi:hypothetical protein